MKALRSIAVGTWLAAQAAGALALDLLVPAYFYPSAVPSLSEWTPMTAALAQGARITAIMNVFNGPGQAPNADYVAAVNAFRAAGGRVLGYDYTCYGLNLCSPQVPPTRSVADVLADAQRYASWYTIDGIFLDEMASDAAALPFYLAVADGLRAAHPGWQIVGNPGTAVPEAYLSVADALVTFENAGSEFAAAPQQPWMAGPQAGRQAVVIHSVPDTAGMQALLATAAARGVGYAYITDGSTAGGGNPYLGLPGYWAAEVAAASAVDEPPRWALALAGLALLSLRRMRRPFRRS